MFITDTIYLSSARERKRNLGVAAAAQGGVGPGFMRRQARPMPWVPRLSG
jgi:hypothetical protein